ncbi:MAG TPA: hypothetical protein VGH42_07695 [Verrucomicrobiae bacterium]|jgi:hypothetical protein
MNIPLITDCVIIISSTCFFFVPFSRKRLRANWAKLLFIIGGIDGIIVGGTYFIFDIHWTAPPSHAFHVVLNYLSGIFLGLIMSLTVSGQLDGTKVAVDENDNLSRFKTS